MLKKLVAALIAVFVMISYTGAMEAAEVKLSDNLEIRGTKLLLNGAGVRSKFFMDLYVGGLYLAEKSSDAAKIVAADEPMAISLNIISSMITSEKMESATRKGFKNSTGGNMAPIEQEIEKFIAVFKEKIEINDVYHFVYMPGKGVEVYKNSKLNSLLTGIEFKKALFGIWLCDKPAQSSLKKEMLGL